MNLKPSGKKLENELFSQNMIFKNLLVYKLNDDIKYIYCLFCFDLIFSFFNETFTAYLMLV